MYSGNIARVKGIRVGHATDSAARTGVTAIVTDRMATAGVDVRGGGPGTRETDALQPGRLVDGVDAVLLSGGSAYGLDAAGGAMRVFEGLGRGYQTAFGRVPIVAQAVLYDLGVGSKSIRPDRDMGALACLCADKNIKQGLVGAGCGATVGKLIPGLTASPGGLGTASIELHGGATIAAIVAVNAAGDVHHPETGALVAGGRDASGRMISAMDQLTHMAEVPARQGNTTIGLIATDAKLNREQVNRLATLGHDGFARAIRPVHLPVDGDTVFALATGEAEADYLLLCALAAEVMARAILNAVEASR